MKQVQFIFRLGRNDRLRHRHRSNKGRIIDFVLQYETRWKGRWYPVVRYDTAHGFAHQDIMRPRSGATKLELTITDFNKAMTYADYDLKTQWRTYKALFLKELRSTH